MSSPRTPIQAQITGHYRERVPSSDGLPDLPDYLSSPPFKPPQAQSSSPLPNPREFRPLASPIPQYQEMAAGSCRRFESAAGPASPPHHAYHGNAQSPPRFGHEDFEDIGDDTEPDDFEGEVFEKDAEIAGLRRANQSLQEDLHQVRRELRNSQDESRQVREELRDSRANTRYVQGLYDDILFENDRLKNEINEGTVVVDDLRYQLETSHRETFEVRVQVENLESEITTLREIKATLREENTALETEVKKFIRSNAKKDTELATAAQQAKDKQSIVDAMVESQEDTQAELVETKEKLSRYKIREKNVSAMYTKAAADNMKLKDEIKDLKLEMEQIHKVSIRDPQSLAVLERKSFQEKIEKKRSRDDDEESEGRCVKRARSCPL